jgi:tRNA A37 threonylcarbamoyladenosine biosynthesis protein TsaE
VVEWGDLAVAFVPGEHLVISMETLDDDARRVTFDPRARSWHERGDALSAAIAAACPGGVAC